MATTARVLITDRSTISTWCYMTSVSPKADAPEFPEPAIRPFLSLILIGEPFRPLGGDVWEDNQDRTTLTRLFRRAAREYPWGARVLNANRPPEAVLRTALRKIKEAGLV
jgi:hypothetical protein